MVGANRGMHNTSCAGRPVIVCLKSRRPRLWWTRPWKRPGTEQTALKQGAATSRVIAAPISAALTLAIYVMDTSTRYLPGVAVVQLRKIAILESLFTYNAPLLTNIFSTALTLRFKILETVSASASLRPFSLATASDR